MSLHGYHVSIKIAKDDPPFYALIMAAMRKADTDNTDKLRRVFPEVWTELQARYNAPMGLLPEESRLSDEELVTLRQRIREIHE